MSSPKNKVNTELLNLFPVQKKSYMSHRITGFAYMQFPQIAQDLTP